MFKLCMITLNFLCFMILILKGVHGDLLLIDPTIEEENVCNTVNPKGSENRGLATLAYLGNLKQVTL